MVRTPDLVPLLNRHQLLAIPSRWEEPFGVVALEAMACGCMPVAADAGGLPEAVGDAGMLFANGNAAALADSIGTLLNDPALIEALRGRAAAHLARHRPGVVAEQYLAVFEEALQ